jgi:hypothetical protein
MPPVHPGEILREELDGLNLSASAFAILIELSSPKSPVQNAGSLTIKCGVPGIHVVSPEFCPRNSDAYEYGFSSNFSCRIDALIFSMLLR